LAAPLFLQVAVVALKHCKWSLWVAHQYYLSYLRTYRLPVYSESASSSSMAFEYPAYLTAARSAFVCAEFLINIQYSDSQRLGRFSPGRIYAVMVVE
jgi:hypothetical protein